MALSEKQRQKKLAKKTAKRKERLLDKKSTGELGAKINQSSLMSSPIHECLISETLFDMGMGHVIISRRVSGDRIGFCMFLLDVYCLGVKNAFASTVTMAEYERKIVHSGINQFVDIQCACAVKLVEDAVAYAKGLGFSPQKDYGGAKKIFGDINPKDCSTEYTFGKDGKPYFITGPHDTLATCKKIMDTLTKSCGSDGFHFTAPVFEG
ncbi:MAG: hypothetical protein HQK95_08255 [Nitrospirae bacterium]|nr:hypothetical protein [Nitrospirota bacterium]